MKNSESLSPNDLDVECRAQLRNEQTFGPYISSYCYVSSILSATAHLKGWIPWVQIWLSKAYAGYPVFISTNKLVQASYILLFNSYLWINLLNISDITLFLMWFIIHEYDAIILSKFLQIL